MPPIKSEVSDTVSIWMPSALSDMSTPLAIQNWVLRLNASVVRRFDEYLGRRESTALVQFVARDLPHLDRVVVHR